MTPVTATGPEAEIVAVAVPRTRARAARRWQVARARVGIERKAMLLPPPPKPDKYSESNVAVNDSERATRDEPAVVVATTKAMRMVVVSED